MSEFTKEEKELMARFPGTVGIGKMPKEILAQHFKRYTFWEYTEDVVVPLYQQELDDLIMGVSTDIFHRANDIARDNGTRENI